MKKLLSTDYSSWAFNAALFILRISLGLMMLPHGYGKLIRFGDLQHRFTNFLGLGSTLSLGLTLFAELVCSVFIIIGLFTRFSVIPLIVVMSVALFKSHGGDIFGDGEKAGLFLAGFITILLVGPGKASVDRLMGK
ncbi:MAG: DoxX family protein [Chitinophagaceae bacterium]|nr:DoxX family protein [Chitinophagaceae bacterium]MCW5928651.1 DoxX family protein [Chitinophagaceae bacterium]